MTDFIYLSISLVKRAHWFLKKRVSDKTSTGLVNITHILEEEKSSKHLSVSESFYVKKKLSHCSMYQVSSRNISLKPVDKTY